MQKRKRAPAETLRIRVIAHRGWNEAVQKKAAEFCDLLGFPFIDVQNVVRAGEFERAYTYHQNMKLPRFYVYVQHRDGFQLPYDLTADVDGPPTVMDGA